jgi:hypothetical protein
MKYTNKHNLPDSIYQAVVNDPYDSKGSDITVTTLLKPPQMVYLERKFKEEITVDVSDCLWSLMGSAMHLVLERADNGAITEQRIFHDVMGWTVSGAFDRLSFSGHILQDYKFNSVWEAIYGLKPEKEQQLNMLVYLARENDFRIESAEVVMLFRDWSKSKAMYDKNYPQQQIMRIPVEIWEREKQQDFIVDRVLLHQQAQDGDCPPCTKEEMWEKDTKYALMKKGRKSAIKLYATQEEMPELQTGQYVEVRKGEKTRCEHYCHCSEFCEQYNT